MGSETGRLMLELPPSEGLPSFSPISRGGVTPPRTSGSESASLLCLGFEFWRMGGAGVLKTEWVDLKPQQAEKESAWGCIPCQVGAAGGIGTGEGGLRARLK